MSVVTLLQPPRIVFGNGCAPNCVELLTRRRLRRLPVTRLLKNNLRPVTEQAAVEIYEAIY